ncbi:unnamed protein product [marine sediment metagenome]|uniref:Uncharacterized protein n=1 Tax=marine sediment metagenome TaxID=412755 RepID=X0ZTX4_9ZZZZ
MSKDNAQVEKLYKAVYNAVCRLTTKWGKPLKTGNYRSIDRGNDGRGMCYVAVSWRAGAPFIRLYASKCLNESVISLPVLERMAEAVIEVDEYYEQQANRRITELVTRLDDILNERE